MVVFYFLVARDILEIVRNRWTQYTSTILEVFQIKSSVYRVTLHTYILTLTSFFILYLGMESWRTLKAWALLVTESWFSPTDPL